MRQALFATIGFTIFYSLQIVLQKLFIKSLIHPLHLNFLTNLSSFIIMTIYLLFFNKKAFIFKTNKKTFIWIFSASLLWIVADLSAIIGLKNSSSINFSILSRLMVIITYLLAILFFKETIKTNKILAIIIAFIGGLIVVYNSNSKIKINTGDILFVIFAITNSISGLLRQKIRGKISPIQLTYIMFGLSVIILGSITQIFLPIVKIEVVKFIVVNSFLCLIGFNLVNYAISKGGASFYSVVSSLLPFVTAIFSFLILKQQPLANQIIGGFIIVFSIFLFQKK